MIKRIKLTTEEVIQTEAYKNANFTLQQIYGMKPYVDAISRWLTFGKYKGKQEMLNMYHINDFKKDILNELYDYKINK